jgi:hypothetical protein
VCRAAEVRVRRRLIIIDVCIYDDDDNETVDEEEEEEEIYNQLRSRDRFLSNVLLNAW